MMWYGKVWYDMAWHGVTWRGAAWHGIVCHIVWDETLMVRYGVGYDGMGWCGASMLWA